MFASKGGPPTNPDWYHNLVANPRAKVEVGTETFDVKARVADDAERAPIWEAQKAQWPGFADYEQKTTRQIPVIILERAPPGWRSTADQHRHQEGRGRDADIRRWSRGPVRPADALARPACARRGSGATRARPPTHAPTVRSRCASTTPACTARGA